jgi:hypothetical protein
MISLNYFGGDGGFLADLPIVGGLFGKSSTEVAQDKTLAAANNAASQQAAAAREAAQIAADEAEKNRNLQMAQLMRQRSLADEAKNLDTSIARNQKIMDSSSILASKLSGQEANRAAQDATAASFAANRTGGGTNFLGGILGAQAASDASTSTRNSVYNTQMANAVNGTTGQQTLLMNEGNAMLGQAGQAGSNASAQMANSVNQIGNSAAGYANVVNAAQANANAAANQYGANMGFLGSMLSLAANQASDAGVKAPVEGEPANKAKGGEVKKEIIMTFRPIITGAPAGGRR